MGVAGAPGPQPFQQKDNHDKACSYHPALYTGGEVAKAIGFIRQSGLPEHQLLASVGRSGLMRFWDCCGSEDEHAPGCCKGRHKTFDEEG
ncbi:hypothetical protein WJX72_010555 [[Myrmecia] bisecta]|uniref:Uncharacterized protein n=1 Tax=[Myrmecia] bisecta TaxID=41462 RepID=A0AAW1Q1W3_9CHLO